MNVEDYLESAPQGTSREKIQQIFIDNRGNEEKIHEAFNAMWSKTDQSQVTDDWQTATKKASKAKKLPQVPPSTQTTHNNTNNGIGKDFNNVKKNGKAHNANFDRRAPYSGKPQFNKIRKEEVKEPKDKLVESKDNVQTEHSDTSQQVEKPKINTSVQNKNSLWARGPPKVHQKQSQHPESDIDVSKEIKIAEAVSEDKEVEALKPNVEKKSVPKGHSYADRLKGVKDSPKSNSKSEIGLNEKQVENLAEQKALESQKSEEKMFEALKEEDDEESRGFRSDSEENVMNTEGSEEKAESQNLAKKESDEFVQIESSENIPEEKYKVEFNKVSQKPMFQSVQEIESDIFKKVSESQDVEVAKAKSGFKLQETFSEDTSTNNLVFGLQNSLSRPRISFESIVLADNKEIFPKGQVSQLEADLKRSKDQIVSLEASLANMKKELEKAKSKLSEAEDNLKLEMKQSSLKVKELENKISSLQTQLSAQAQNFENQTRESNNNSQQKHPGAFQDDYSESYSNLKPQNMSSSTGQNNQPSSRILNMPQGPTSQNLTHKKDSPPPISGNNFQQNFQQQQQQQLPPNSMFQSHANQNFPQANMFGHINPQMYYSNIPSPYFQHQASGPPTHMNPTQLQNNYSNTPPNSNLNQRPYFENSNSFHETASTLEKDPTSVGVGGNVNVNFEELNLSSQQSMRRHPSELNERMNQNISQNMMPGPPGYNQGGYSFAPFQSGLSHPGYFMHMYPQQQQQQQQQILGGQQNQPPPRSQQTSGQQQGGAYWNRN